MRASRRSSPCPTTADTTSQARPSLPHPTITDETAPHPRTSLPLHLRLQAIDLHLRVLAAALRRLDLFLQPLDFALDEVEPAVDGHDGVGAVLFEEDGADEFVDLGGGGVGG